nr:hypothetical protein [Mucilaginibacter sp. SP1R1]
MFTKLMYCKHLYSVLNQFVLTNKPHLILSKGEDFNFAFVNPLPWRGQGESQFVYIMQ